MRLPAVRRQYPAFNRSTENSDLVRRFAMVPHVGERIGNSVSFGPSHRLLPRAKTTITRLRLAAPWGGHPLQRNEPIEPFFIIGSGRSGTTLLRRILVAHPDVFIPPETYVLGNVIKNFSLLKRLPWSKIVTYSLAQFEYHHEFTLFETSLRPLVIELRQAPLESRSLAYLLDRFYRHTAEQSGWPRRSRWGDKTPRNSYWLDEIFSVFPRAKFIHLVRDGYDFVESAARMSGRARRLNPIEAAWYWRRSVRACREFGGRWPLAYRELKYEALVVQPETEVQRLCEFIHLQYHPTMLEVNPDQIARMGDVPTLTHHAHVAEPISARFRGKGRTVLASETLRQVSAVIDEDIVKLGYRPMSQ